MQSREPGVITQPFIDLLRQEFRLEWGGIHGSAHWARVRINGLRLALYNGANMRVVEYFAFLHDVCRHNDGRDPEHGARAARFAESIRHSSIALSDEEFPLLITAIEGHTHSHHHEDITVRTCWDADRLDLARVCIDPDPAHLCTEEARAPAFIARASESAQIWLKQYLDGCHSS